jgi:hypothetical protein
MASAARSGMTVSVVEIWDVHSGSWAEKPWTRHARDSQGQMQETLGVKDTLELRVTIQTTMQWTSAVLWDSLWCPRGVLLLSDSQGLRDLLKSIRGINVLGVRRYGCSSNNSMYRLIKE